MTPALGITFLIDDVWSGAEGFESPNGFNGCGVSGPTAFGFETTGCCHTAADLGGIPPASLELLLVALPRLVAFPLVDADNGPAPPPEVDDAFPLVVGGVAFPLVVAFPTGGTSGAATGCVDESPAIMGARSFAFAELVFAELECPFHFPEDAAFPDVLDSCQSPPPAA